MPAIVISKKEFNGNGGNGGNGVKNGNVKKKVINIPTGKMFPVKRVPVLATMRR
ncbi:MAG: hypothetical protein V1656_00360 [Candidatus Jorgensenbacteria bacterium]